MIFKNACLVIAALTLSSNAGVAAKGFDLIAGYQPRTDVSDYLAKDLIIRAFEEAYSDKGNPDQLEQEACELLEGGKAFWNSDSMEQGGYLRSIPTWGDGPGELISPSVQEFRKYYNEDDFHLRWVKAALNQKNYKSGATPAGDALFKKGFCNDDDGCYPTTYPSETCTLGPDTTFFGPCVGVEKSIQGAVQNTFVFIEAMQLMERAIYEVEENFCAAQKGCMDAMKYWDASVAIFVGSEEGIDGTPFNPPENEGQTLYYQSDKFNHNFCTGGQSQFLEDSDVACWPDVTANANINIMSFYSGGQQATYFGDIVRMRQFQRVISDKMAIPFIQGVLKHAWYMSDENVDDSSNCGFSPRDKNIARAAVFGMGALPKVNACSKKGAEKIHTEIKIGGIKAGKKGVNYQNVRLGMECNYQCLGITCNEINELVVSYSEGTGRTQDGKCEDADVGAQKCPKKSQKVKKKCKMFTGSRGVDNTIRPESDWIIR